VIVVLEKTLALTVAPARAVAVRERVGVAIHR
jgi:hypothetical protein